MEKPAGVHPTRVSFLPRCGVPEDLLGERGGGFPEFLEILDGGRISIAAMGLGLAQAAYGSRSLRANGGRSGGRSGAPANPV